MICCNWYKYSFGFPVGGLKSYVSQKSVRVLCVDREKIAPQKNISPASTQPVELFCDLGAWSYLYVCDVLRSSLQTAVSRFFVFFYIPVQYQIGVLDGSVQ